MIGNLKIGHWVLQFGGAIERLASEAFALVGERPGLGRLLEEEDPGSGAHRRDGHRRTAYRFRGKASDIADTL